MCHPPRLTNNAHMSLQDFLLKSGLHIDGHYTIALSHDAESRATYGLMEANTDWGSLHIRVGRRIHAIGHLSCQPMLLPAVAGEHVLTLSLEKIKDAERRLGKLEEATGQHTFSTRPKGDPLQLDFIVATRSLNSTSMTLGVVEMRLKAILATLRTLVDFIDHLQPSTSKGRMADSASDSGLLKEYVAYLTSLADNMLLRTRFNQERTQTQLQVVYNFMSQKDNLVNIEVAADSRKIAQASKRDSSAMKSIALLTMVFLPGTFVAVRPSVLE